MIILIHDEIIKQLDIKELFRFRDTLELMRKYADKVDIDNALYWVNARIGELTK